MSWIWLIIIIFLIFLEAATVDLVSVWFIASAFVSLILSVFIDNYFIQFSTFVILGTVLLLTTRKYLVNLINVNKEKTNLDRVVGMNGVVTAEIKRNKYGEVKVDGKRWTAYSNKNIKVDSTVKVLEIDGVKLKVEEAE